MSLSGTIFMILLLGAVFVNGSTDAPNTVTNAVSTNSLPINKALLISASMNFIGLFISVRIGNSVALSVADMYDFQSSLSGTYALCSALFSVIVWGGITYIFGLPSSESHALISSLAGSALASKNASIDDVLFKRTILFLFLTIILGFIFGFVFSKAVSKTNLTENFYNKAHTLFCYLMSFLHGAQDGQKFIALYLLYSGENKISLSVLLIFCLVLFIGTFCGGRKIIYTLGSKMANLTKAKGFACDIASGMCVLISTVFGIPVSTSHIKSSAIIGTSFKHADKGIITELVLSWIMTFPACFGMGYVVTKIFFA